MTPTPFGAKAQAPSRSLRPSLTTELASEEPLISSPEVERGFLVPPEPPFRRFRRDLTDFFEGESVEVVEAVEAAAVATAQQGDLLRNIDNISGGSQSVLQVR